MKIHFKEVQVGSKEVSGGSCNTRRFKMGSIGLKVVQRVQKGHKGVWEDPWGSKCTPRRSMEAQEGP